MRTWLAVPYGHILMKCRASWSAYGCKLNERRGALPTWLAVPYGHILMKCRGFLECARLHRVSEFRRSYIPGICNHQRQKGGG